MGWAVTTVVSPAPDVSEATPYTYVSVVAGEVGASIHLNTVVEWKPVPVGVNRGTGVVTSVTVGVGDEVGQGSVLYTIDLRPVVVAEGEVPAFRAISLGAEGADVAQLQTMLSDMGVYAGSSDGTAGARTIESIKTWQKNMGVAQTGVVEPGDVIFVPTLPTRVALDGAVVFRGATLNGGEPAVRALPSSPTFDVPVTDTQAGLLPPGTRVELTSPDGGQWLGYTAESTAHPESATVTVALEGARGAAVCGDECGQVPVTGDVALDSRVVTVESVTGLVVPSAALVTDAGGQVAVLTEDGERRTVIVTAAARGMSVIDGVEAGTRVRVPGEEP
ncbi:peptidoglycan-binding protein [Microbacterium rhizomatis]|uniref:Peptidoglycan-binding protein n=1 Tax=Microbacterium rhizomatis TaxID=1631477 RepID=A0A5J5J974_9MICO|nr:peptidoglycan-binding protein [Microbacterium rhizomatis]